MFNRGCRPNLLAVIAAQKEQSIQRSVTEARTNLCTKCARSSSTDVDWIDCNVYELKNTVVNLPWPPITLVIGPSLIL